MRFVITGGAGFIGSHIARQLFDKAKGEIVVIDNLKVGRLSNIPKGCHFYKCDIRDKVNLLKIFNKRVDIVFHNAAFVSIRGSFDPLLAREEIETNCLGTLNVLEAAVKACARRFIFASSMAVYGLPQYLPVDEGHPTIPVSPYGLSKLRGEYLCRIFEKKHGLQSTILRYFNTYGLGQTPSDYVGVMTIFINQLLSRKSVTIFGHGRQTRDFVSVNDVARANLLAAFSKKHGIFNVASGRDMSINRLASLIIEKAGCGAKTYKSSPEGEINRIRADISAIKRVLSFEPQEHVEASLQGILDWWKTQK